MRANKQNAVALFEEYIQSLKTCVIDEVRKQVNAMKQSATEKKKSDNAHFWFANFK